MSNEGDDLSVGNRGYSGDCAEELAGNPERGEECPATETGHAGMHCNLGTALAAQGQLAEAIACYRRAIELAPNFAEAHFNQGFALLKLGSPATPLLVFSGPFNLNPIMRKRTTTWATPSRTKGCWTRQ